MTTAAQVTLAAVAAFSPLLIIVHVLKPEIDPSWRMISEYEIGRHGWLMRLAFVCWSVSVLAVAVALWPYASILGDVALVVVGVGPLGAAVFATDPITTPPGRRASPIVGTRSSAPSLFLASRWPPRSLVGTWPARASSPRRTAGRDGCRGSRGAV
jgi:Protein of unknown function (DUF998)